MHWLNDNLNRKFAAGTAAGLLVSSLFFLILFMSLYRGQLEDERARTAEQVSRLVQTSLEGLIRKGDDDGVREMVNRLASEPGILGVSLTDPAGGLRFASGASRFAAFDRSDAMDEDWPAMRLLEDQDGRAILRSVNPIATDRACPGCDRPRPDRSPGGILYVDFDAAPIRDKAWTTTLLLMGSGALIVLINITGGWWFIRRYVMRPVERLSEVSQRLMRGDLDARIHLPGRDEFSLLGDHFNRMADSLQSRLRELREKEVFLQGLVDAVPDGIRVIDRDYRVVLSNVTYRQQLGFRETDRPPQFCYAAAHARDTPCPDTLTLCTLQQVLSTGEPLRVVHRHVKVDGGSLDVEVYAAPMQAVRDGRPTPMVVESIRDLEQQVRFSHEQRLSELGRLAAGVAHEIHNPLTALRLALHEVEQISRDPRPDSGKLAEYLELVDHEVTTCERVTGRLLKLSMPPPSQPELVVLEQIVEETVKLLGWEAKEQGIDLGFEVEGRPLRVLAADSDLRMMTLNLAQNACHAMPGGGRLSVRCFRSEEQIAVAFEDTGVGIGPGDRFRIFEPFFSRRADGVRGTGLGLSITKAIVESHGGAIQVDSVLGQGSRFTVLFPDADAAAMEH